MLEAVRGRLREALRQQLLVDGIVTHTGDDIAIIMSRTRGRRTGDGGSTSDRSSPGST